MSGSRARAVGSGLKGNCCFWLYYLVSLRKRKYRDRINFWRRIFSGRSLPIKFLVCQPINLIGRDREKSWGGRRIRTRAFQVRNPQHCKLQITGPVIWDCESQHWRLCYKWAWLSSSFSFKDQKINTDIINSLWQETLLSTKQMRT